MRAALRAATAALLAELTPEGHWSGELSSSALATATAVNALAGMGEEADAALIRGGLLWLAAHQNSDGGWGDTVRSKSNLSTTALGYGIAKAAGWAALGASPQLDQMLDGSGRWLADFRRDRSGSLAELIAGRYGRDRTFSVPILVHLALCRGCRWEEVPRLPFELAALPHQIFGALQLPMVSYALPALIAIGQTIHHHHPTPNRLLHWIRERTRARTLRVLETTQPANGGFLEATPLTSFVTMSLAAMGLAAQPVAQRGAAFLRASVRADGSWPIDTNLATWTTTLAIKALAHQPAALSPEQRLTLRAWLLGQQYRTEHPYTHAAPGGWAWTNLPGGVPDADDTAGVLLALLHLGAVDAETRAAGVAGLRWLQALQNRDGGIPTFCRGWGALPFDRSAPDLTAHALRAWSAWLPQLDDADKTRARRSIARGLTFLAATQRADGAWLPLWFGNEHAPDDENPVYGTAKVVLALRELQERGLVVPRGMLERALRWLIERQDKAGGWSGAQGGPASMEETALAVEALAGTSAVSATERGTGWLRERIESGAWREPAPIGFYFARLWYYERLYPLIWTAGALGRVAALQ